MNGAEALCEALQALGVECIFGVPGSQNLPLYEALRRSRIRTIVPTHELAGSFMANGYYRASGRPGVLVTIPGPGFTYAVPGLVEARQDSAALLHIVGQPPTGSRSFQLQAIDQRSMVEGVVKAAYLAADANDMAPVAASALEMTRAGEPGPVLLEHSVRAMEGTVDAAAERARPAGSAPPVLEAAALEEAVALLAAARHPLIMAGQGCADAHLLVRALAELLPAPVFTTLSGRGVLPEDHPLALGYDFARGDVQVLNELIRRSDCVLAVGCKLSAAGTDAFRLELPGDRLIHVDASPAVLGATYVERLAIAAPVESFLERALSALPRTRGSATAAWTPAEVAGWTARLRAPTGEAGLEPVFPDLQTRNAEGFFAALRGVLPRDGIVVADSGLHQTLARRYLEVRSPRGLIVPSDFQSMGFGLPAAIGAKLAAPDRTVVAVIGDGGFAMSAMELLTAVRERIALTLVVFNDGQLNRIRLQQLAQYGHASGCEILNPDFEAFANAVGVHYARGQGDVEGMLRTAVERDSPTLVEVVLGDSAAIRVERARGLARGSARRALRSPPLRWLTANRRRSG